MPQPWDVLEDKATTVVDLTPTLNDEFDDDADVAVDELEQAIDTRDSELLRDAYENHGHWQDRDSDFHGAIRQDQESLRKYDKAFKSLASAWEKQRARYEQDIRRRQELAQKLERLSRRVARLSGEE